MNSIKVAFFDAKPFDVKSFESINKDFGYRIKFFEDRLNEDTVSLTKNFDVVCVFVNDILNKGVIKILKENGVKLIALRCAGFNNVDLKEAFNTIPIVRVPAYSPYAVAEHAVSLIMTLNRKTHKAYNRTRENNFSLNGLLGFDMYGKTVGIIGTGKIGKILTNILKAFGMRVLLYDLFPDKEFAKNNNIEYCELDKIYRESDIISLHCPLTKETTHLINKDALSKMKTGVMIINTSRGQLIDTKALIGALKEGRIGSAGLDVYEEESEYFFEDHSGDIIGDDMLARLLTFNNVLVTSHQAFFTKEALKNIGETTLNNIKEYFDSGKLTNGICYQCNLSTGAK